MFDWETTVGQGREGEAASAGEGDERDPRASFAEPGVDGPPDLGRRVPLAVELRGGACVSGQVREDRAHVRGELRGHARGAEEAGDRA